MKFRKSLSLLLSLVLLLTLAACGTGGSSKSSATSASSTGETQKTTNAPVKKDNGKVVVDFWHSMGGTPGKTLQGLVDNFNKSQDKIEVKLDYQGSYNEALNKFKTVAGTDHAPAIIQVYDIGTKYMIDSGFIRPVQDFIDKDKFDASSFEENILNYYSVNKKLYSMPFNSSNAIMFYNKDAFKNAGLDPNKPPHTYSEVKKAAEALTKKNGSTTESYGFAILIHGWFFEQLMANQGGLMVNNDNGRSASPTKAVFNNKEGVRTLTWLQDMNKEGVLGNFGRKWNDIRAAFKAGKVDMYLDSTAATAGNIQNSPFKVGTAFIPVPDGVDSHGVVIGGGSLWMTNSIPQATQDAAWTFIKYLTNAKNQATWAINTGYFPVTKKAYDEQSFKDNLKKYPQFSTAIEQLHQTKPSIATQGALMGVFPEVRNDIETEIEKLYQGSIEPKPALDEAVNKVNQALDIYNKTAGK